MVGSVDLANHVASLEDVDTAFDGKPLPETSEDDQTMADSTITIRCNHCGHLVFFDKTFVEEQIHE